MKSSNMSELELVKFLEDLPPEKYMEIICKTFPNSISPIQKSALMLRISFSAITGKKFKPMNDEEIQNLGV